jgi:hypothetical protein
MVIIGGQYVSWLTFIDWLSTFHVLGSVRDATQRSVSARSVQLDEIDQVLGFDALRTLYARGGAISLFNLLC